MNNSHESAPSRNSSDRPPITSLADYMNRLLETKLQKYRTLSFEERLPIKERARTFRYGPTGYNEDEALLVAIDELVKVSDEEIGVSLEELEAIIRTQIQPYLPEQ